METSVPQSSPSTSAPNKKERQKVLKQCERTILCIPDGTGKPLDDKEVRTALGVKRVVVIRDDHTGGYWVRGGDEAKQVFLNRLGERLPGYTARALVPEGDDWRRLLQKIEVGGVAPPPSSIEEGIGSSSTSHQAIAPGGNRTQVGGSLAWPAGESSGAGGSGSSLDASLGRTSFDRATTGSDVRSKTEPHRPKRARKRGRLTRDALQVPSKPRKRRTLKLDFFFAKLPDEVIIHIFELCLKDAATFEEYNHILEKLVDQGGRCAKILQDTPTFWTKITSASPHTLINMALTSSQTLPIHVEGGPDQSAVGVERFNEFISVIKPHRERSASLSLRFPSTTLNRIKNYLAGPVPSLVALSLTMTDITMASGRALAFGAALGREIGRPLDILGRKAGKLQRVFLKNIPCVWDPSPFTAIIDLALMNGVHLHYNRVIDFFRRSSNIQSIRFVDIKFIGRGPQVLEETILLPHLRVLVLTELTQPVGLGILFISLDTPNCVHTRLDIRPGGAASLHPAFQLRVATTVQKVLALGKPSFLLFRSNNSTQGASWRSRDGDGDWGNEEEPSFEISFRGAGGGFAGYFCDLVQRGTIDEPFDLENQIIPTLLPSLFAELNVVEVRAVVVAGFLEPFKDMLGPVEGEGWCFRALRTIRLHAIPPEELTVLPDPSAQCSLDSLIDHICREHDGIDLNEGKPEDGPSMTIALKGWFGISTEMGRDLEKGDVLSGIKIDHTEATLAYVRVQEERKEEEEEVDGEDPEEVEEVEGEEVADEEVESMAQINRLYV